MFARRGVVEDRSGRSRHIENVGDDESDGARPADQRSPRIAPRGADGFILSHGIMCMMTSPTGSVRQLGRCRPAGMFRPTPPAACDSVEKSNDLSGSPRRHGLRAQIRRGARGRARRGLLRRPHHGRRRGRAGRSRPHRRRGPRAAQPHRRPRRRVRSRTAPSPPPPGWKEAYDAWRKGGWNGLAGAGRVGRPGAAARRQRRLHRNVERAPPWRSASARC